MTKKRSLIVALVAFAALMLPLSRLVSFADSLLCTLLAQAGCVNVPWGLQSQLVIAAYECFGPVWSRPDTDELIKPYLSFKWRSTAASSPFAATSRGKRR